MKMLFAVIDMSLFHAKENLVGREEVVFGEGEPGAFRVSCSVFEVRDDTGGPRAARGGLSFSSWVGRVFLGIKGQLHSGFRTGLHSAVVKAQVSFTCACFLTC